MAKMNKKRKRLLLNIGFVIFLVAITLVVLFVSQKDDLNFKQIGEYFKNGNPVWIVGAFACMIMFTVFEGVSIYFISRFFGKKNNIISCTAYSAANGFYSAITPTAAGGQPAAVFYMARDGMSPGKASFGILVNTIGYTAAIFAIGIAAICIDPSLFGGINSVFAKVLVIAGAVIQLGLLGLYIGCMFFGKAIIKLGNGIITLLNKIRIVKNTEKWRTKLKDEVTMFGECRRILREKPLVMVTTLIFNILQRVSQTLIPCFVCLAVDPDTPFLSIFALQAYVLFGYNSVPLPGGVGAYEFLFMNVYSQIFPETSFVLLVLMISRLFSFYLSLIWSGVYTLTYHMAKVKKITDEPASDEQPTEDTGAEQPTSEEQSESEDGAQEGANEPPAAEEKKEVAEEVLRAPEEDTEVTADKN